MVGKAGPLWRSAPFPFKPSWGRVKQEPVCYHLTILFSTIPHSPFLFNQAPNQIHTDLPLGCSFAGERAKPKKEKTIYLIDTFGWQQIIRCCFDGLLLMLDALIYSILIRNNCHNSRFPFDLTRANPWNPDSFETSRVIEFFSQIEITILIHWAHRIPHQHKQASKQTHKQNPEGKRGPIFIHSHTLTYIYLLLLLPALLSSTVIRTRTIYTFYRHSCRHSSRLGFKSKLRQAIGPQEGTTKKSKLSSLRSCKPSFLSSSPNSD